MSAESHNGLTHLPENTILKENECPTQEETTIKMHLTEWLRPQSAAKDASRIDYAAFRARGIRLALLDLDNTLSAHGSNLPDEFARAVIAQIRKAGIQPMLATNARRSRALNFAGALGIPVIPVAAKPLPFKIRKEMNRLGFRRDEAMLIGDQIFTDVLAARLVGVHAMLVQPRYASEAWNVRIKRWLEKPLLRGIHFPD